MKRTTLSSLILTVVLMIAGLFGAPAAASATNIVFSTPSLSSYMPDGYLKTVAVYNVETGKTELAYVTKAQATGGSGGGPLANTSTQTLISFRGQVSQVIVQKIGSLTNLFGHKGWNVDLNVFGGFEFTANGLTGGGSATHSFKASPELDFIIGVFIQGTSQKKIDGGLAIGASLHFNSGS